MDATSRIVLRAVLFASVAAILFLLIWYAIDVLLVVFAGVLVAIFLRGLGDALAARTPLSRRWALVVVILTIAGVCFAAGWFLWPGIATQIDQMMTILPRTVHYWIAYLQRYEWGQWILLHMPEVERAIIERMNLAGLAYNVVEGLTAAFIVVFVGLYLSGESGSYYGGFLKLIPPAKRRGVEEMLDRITSTLRWWMVGRATAMVSVGIINAIGLGIIGVPLARTLAIIAALLTFIPYIGSLIAVIPTMLVALTVSPGLVLGAVAVHFIAQSVEAYLVTPIAQKKAIEMPPALTITSQFLLGAWAGVLGILFATPLAAIGLVLVSKLYLKEEPKL